MTGTYIIENKSDLDKKLEDAEKKLVIIDFFAAWCGPCRLMGPVLEKYAEEHPEIMFLKVDVDDNGDLAKTYNILLMPTILFVKEKKVLESFSGSNYEKVLEKIQGYKENHNNTK